jgi:shikimate 5-dehydrogenase
VAARDEAKRKMLADEFGISVIPFSGSNDQSGSTDPSFDIVVNATPLGMEGPWADKTPLTAPQLTGVKFVFDLVTSKVKTPLLIEAEAAGVPCVGGSEMLISQAAKQFEIWTGRPAPVDVMRGAMQ